MKKTAVAPSNIAFIKYWGKKDESLRIPLNPSFSMNLDGSYTTTTVEFSKSYSQDSVEIVGGTFSLLETERIAKALTRMREYAKDSSYARVCTKNTFPKGAGAASSASGFAALTVAGFAALGTELVERELTEFARLGSGSACRSIPDGFVLWEETSARSLYPHDYWDIRDILVIVDASMKKTTTSDGHKGVFTSPYMSNRIAHIPERLSCLLHAMKCRDFQELGNVSEQDCLDMHHVMQTQHPPLNYWTDATKNIMHHVREWRAQGISVYFTIDAGPNVHILCEGKDEQLILEKLTHLDGIQKTILNKPAQGAHLVDTHLF